MDVKKITKLLHYVLFSLIALLPAGKLITAIFGYTFALFSIPVFAVVTALLAVCTVVLSIIQKEPIYDRGFNVVLALLTPLSLINAVVLFVECVQADIIFRGTVILCCIVCTACCIALDIMNGQKRLRKIITLVLTLLLSIPVGYIGFIALIFGGIRQDTVVQTVRSPEGTYYAEVIDSDQGALGGDTIVNVREDKGFDALLFKVEKKPQRVYFGQWGEFMDMEVYWKNNNCLVINSTEYEIP